MTKLGEKEKMPEAIFSACNALLGTPRCFICRKKDGMFYRGARLWKWTGNWRKAALLDEDFVRSWLFADGRLDENEVVIITASFSLPNAVAQPRSCPAQKPDEQTEAGRQERRPGAPG